MYIPASWLYFDVEYLSEMWDMHLQGDTEIKKVTPIYAASLSRYFYVLWYPKND